uniref:Uncharacterized protein n=1 Tax=Arundo donax TaxID=35708 RepID=A0A0A9D1B6_ARUDO
MHHAHDHDHTIKRHQSKQISEIQITIPGVIQYSNNIKKQYHMTSIFNRYLKSREVYQGSNKQ